MRILKGSGYIEILMSVALFSAFAIPLYGWFFYADANQIKSNQVIVAQAALQERVEYYRSIEPSLLVPATTTQAYPDLPDGEITTVITEVADVSEPYLTKVVVTLSWQATGQTETAKIATVIRH